MEQNFDEYNIEQTEQSQPQSKGSGFLKELLSWIKAILTAAVIAYVVQNFVIVNAMVPTGSMENTIMSNDRVIAFRLSYLFNDPSRFDIIVFRNPDNPDLLYIKRIIGMPGETIMITGGNVYIDGEELVEDAQFIKEEFFGTFGPFTAGDGEFFVLGDNRNRSEDSRAWDNPFVPEDLIVGRAVFKYFRGFEVFR